MRDRIRPATKHKFKKAIRDVVKSLSKPVLVYKQPKKEECPNCFWDQMTGKSTGKCKWTAFQARTKQLSYEASGGTGTMYKYFKYGRCPVCLGAGYLSEDRKEWVKCLVIWEPERGGFNNKYTYIPAGIEDSVVVILKTDPKYESVFKNCLKIVVDDIECILSKPPVKRGLGNDALLIVTAYTNSTVTIERDEIRKTYR